MLYVSLCKDVEAKWDEVEKWFNRNAVESDTMSDIGLGQYKMEGQHIRFSTSAFDRECSLWVELDHSVRMVGDRLQVRTVMENDPHVIENEFVPLRAAQDT